MAPSRPAENQREHIASGSIPIPSIEESENAPEPSPQPTLDHAQDTEDETANTPETKNEPKASATQGATVPAETDSKTIRRKAFSFICRQYPELKSKPWLREEIRALLGSYPVSPRWTNCAINTQMFERWSKARERGLVNGEPSLAGLMACIGVHETVMHLAYNKFRYVLLEERIVDKIKVLLAKPNLSPQQASNLIWKDLPTHAPSKSAKRSSSLQRQVEGAGPQQQSALSNDPVKVKLEKTEGDNSHKPILPALARNVVPPQTATEAPPAKRPRTVDRGTWRATQTDSTETKDQGVQTSGPDLDHVVDSIKAIVPLVAQSVRTTIQESFSGRSALFNTAVRTNVKVAVQEMQNAAQNSRQTAAGRGSSAPAPPPAPPGHAGFPYQYGAYHDRFYGPQPIMTPPPSVYTYSPPQEGHPPAGMSPGQPPAGPFTDGTTPGH